MGEPKTVTLACMPFEFANDGRFQKFKPGKARLLVVRTEIGTNSKQVVISK